MVRATFGSAAEVPFGPASPLLWIRHGAPAPAAAQRRRGAPAARRARLGRSRWRRQCSTANGRPLALTLMLSRPPARSGSRSRCRCRSSSARSASGSTSSAWSSRSTTSAAPPGGFDIDFAATSQDPSPTGLTQGWSCSGGTNVARYCDPAVDSLIDAAARDQGRRGRGLAGGAAPHRGGRAGRVHVRASPTSTRLWTAGSATCASGPSRPGSACGSGP